MDVLYVCMYSMYCMYVYMYIYVYCVNIKHVVDAQVARQRLGQHWFITECIAAYKQGLYTVYNGAGVQGAVAVLV
jgi:hypothetical protein